MSAAYLLSLSPGCLSFTARFKSFPLSAQSFPPPDNPTPYSPFLPRWLFQTSASFSVVHIREDFQFRNRSAPAPHRTVPIAPTPDSIPLSGVLCPLSQNSASPQGSASDMSPSVLQRSPDFQNHSLSFDPSRAPFNLSRLQSILSPAPADTQHSPTALCLRTILPTDLPLSATTAYQNHHVNSRPPRPSHPPCASSYLLVCFSPPSFLSSPGFHLGPRSDPPDLIIPTLLPEIFTASVGQLSTRPLLLRRRKSAGHLKYVRTSDALTIPSQVSQPRLAGQSAAQDVTSPPSFPWTLIPVAVCPPPWRTVRLPLLTPPPRSPYSLYALLFNANPLAAVNSTPALDVVVLR
ncbi:hypothetical protein Tco_0199217 [Tanacetum coccineum]